MKNDALLKKLNESTISIHTVEIQSTCEVHQVLKKCPLPSCLKILLIRENSLNFEDITDLLRSLGSVNDLHALDLSGTKFKENTFYAFICSLSQCKDITSLILTDNSLTEQEINGLITVLKSVKDLKTLNLSKCILTEIQANAILQKHEQAKNIVSLDLSQNAIQGNKIVFGVCQLQSLEKLDLSHNCVRFSPLPNLEGKRDHLSTCLKVISLSSNHMKPDDIFQFCSLITSNLSNLNLDFNHVGHSICSFCSLGERIKHLKELSLANTDICHNVDGLVFLLSLVRELEDLNLSCNNLLAEDFQQLQTPLSKLTQLKTLNLSMNAIGPDGMKALAFKEFPLLERLDMSSSYIREDDVSVLCKSLVSLNKLKFLDLSGNNINIEVLNDALALPATLEELLLSDVIHSEKLFAEMKKLQNLKKLYLNNFILRECDVEALGIMLPCFLKLEELSLAVLAAPECETILTAIKSLRNIRKIDLTGIRLCSEEKLVDMLSSLSSLEELVLADMNGTYVDYENLFSAIKLLKRLRLLNLGGVKVFSGPEAFFDMLSSLSILEDIVFPSFILTNTHSDCVPRCFDALESLRCIRSLELGRINEFSSEALARVLPSLQLLEKLGIEFVLENDYDITPNELFAACGKLKYLKELSVVELGKRREISVNSLAEVLQSLQFLERLELGFSSDAEEYEILFDALGTLRYLKEFSCVGYIRQGNIVAFSHALSSLPLLEKLALKISSLQIEYLEQLCVALVNVRYLKKLDLDFFAATITEAQALTMVLPSLEMLEELKLNGTIMIWHPPDHELKKQVFAAISKMRYLKKLYLRNFFLSIDIPVLAKMLSSLKLLEKLNLESHIKLNESKSKEFFIALGKLQYLKKLGLVWKMKITRTNVEALVGALLSLRMLEKIRLEALECRNESESKKLLNAIGKLKQLKKLNLGCFIKITRNNLEALVKALTSLRVLEKLKLRNIYDISESPGKELLIALRKLKYLKELELRWEKITQTNVDDLVKTLASLQVLNRLRLQVNFYCKHDCDDKCDGGCGHDCVENCNHKCDDKCDDECDHECDDECRGKCDDEYGNDCGDECCCPCYHKCNAKCRDECGHDSYDDSCHKCRHVEHVRNMDLVKIKVLPTVKKLKYFKTFMLNEKFITN